MSGLSLLLGLAAGTLLSEDLATIGAGLLAAEGRLAFAAATFACLAGIFAGDLGLYALGRSAGRTRALQRLLARLAPAGEALAVLAREPVDVVVSDERMPGMSGSHFLAAVRRQYPETIRMMLTGQATLEAAVRAINEGEIYRFFTKPCNPEDLRTTIRQALEQKARAAHQAALLETVKEQATGLAELESHFPGITRVRRDADGAVVLDEE